MNFASDNWAGASEPVLQALVTEARRSAAPYGADDLARLVEERLSDLFECELSAFLLATGTAANALALSAYSRPGGVVFAHRVAHVASDECGAPEFLGGGSKLALLGGERAKIDPAEFRLALGEFSPNAVQHGQAVAVSISQVTELGAAYAADEIQAIAGIAHSHGLKVHMDGARFANAVVALGCAPAEVTWKAGVDVLSFGATKNGCVGAEVAVFFDRQAAADFPYLRKRSGHLLSKARIVAAQILAYLQNGHWLDLARRANGAAARLADGIGGSRRIRLALPRDANEIFAILPEELAAALRTAGGVFYDWSPLGLSEQDRPGEGEVLIRLVTNFSTPDSDIERFLTLL